MGRNSRQNNTKKEHTKWKAKHKTQSINAL
jgi:hypothetical protein